MYQRFSLSPYPKTARLSCLELPISKAFGSTPSIFLLIPKVSYLLFCSPSQDSAYLCFCPSLYHFGMKFNTFFDFYSQYQIFISLIIWGEGHQKESSRAALCLLLSSSSNHYCFSHIFISKIIPQILHIVHAEQFPPESWYQLPSKPWNCGEEETDLYFSRLFLLP